MSSTVAQALGIEVSGNYAYAVESGGGLAIFKLTPEAVRIVEHPANQRTAAGDTATFTVRAYGQGPVTYQWYLGKSGDVSQPIAGADAPTFATPPLTEPVECWVRVRSTAGMIDSRSARANLALAVSVELLGLWPGWRRNPENGSAVDVAISGQHALVADGPGGLRIIDISDPAQPRPVGVYPSNARAVAASGRFVLSGG